MFFHKLGLHQRPTAMKSALAAAAPLAFAVRERSTQPVAQPIAERQKFEKTFALEQPADAKATTSIHRLVVSSPGLTFVNFDANASCASVKVSAENADAIDAFEVVQLSDAALEIRLAIGTRLEPQYILTQVSLPTPDALRQLEVNGAGSVVLADGVLATNNVDADLRLQLSGSGDVYANANTGVRAHSLTVGVSGSGDIQVIAPSITLADRLQTKVSSSGDLRVFTGELHASHVALTTAGSGDLQLAALMLDVAHTLEASVSGSGYTVVLGDSLQTRVLTASVAGSGDVKLVAAKELSAGDVTASVSGSGDINVASANAQCGDTKVAIRGSGTVDARDLVTRRANVNIHGSGNVLLRASEAVRTHVGGSGSVTVVGAMPAEVNGRVKTKSEQDKPSLVEKLTENRHQPARIPTPVDAFEQLTRFNGSYNVRSFSDFITAIQMLWNHKSGDKITIKAGTDATSP